MGWFQYFSFQKLDEPLSKNACQHLRSCSSRATITASSFTNFYNFGSPSFTSSELMARHFDIGVEISDWARHFWVSLPDDAIDRQELLALAEDYGIEVEESPRGIVMDFGFTEEEPGDYTSDHEQWLAVLAPLRRELVAGDYRAMFLLWLFAIERMHCESWSDLDADHKDLTRRLPTVPPNLHRPTNAQQALIRFLGIDEGLVAAAAELSADKEEEIPTKNDVRIWLSTLPAERKDEWLTELMLPEVSAPAVEIHVRKAFRKSFLISKAKKEPTPQKLKGSGTNEIFSVGELLDLAEQKSNELQKQHQEKQQQQRISAWEDLLRRSESLCHQVRLDLHSRSHTQRARAVERLVQYREACTHGGEVPLKKFRRFLADVYASHPENGAVARRLREVFIGDLGLFG